MFKNEYVLSVDLKKSMSAVIPTFVQYDNATLLFKIYDDGKPYDLTAFTSAEVTHKRPDGIVVTGTATLENLSNGVKGIRYTYSGNEMSKPGFVSTSLSLYSSGKKVTIQPFKVEIIIDANEDSIVSAPEYGILQQLITTVDQSIQGAANLHSVGTFTQSTLYLKNNIVTSNGSSWIALTNTQNNPLPTLPTTQNTWWRLLAQKGADGTSGTGGGGTVTKVNNISPDGNGNITLTPANIGAAPTSHTHTTAQITNLDTTLAAKYVKPANGIPSTDLTTAIQTSLSKADSALQSVPDASTTTKGIVQLNNTLISTSTSQAVTAAQAKALNDAATTHATTKATVSQLGHVMPDGTTIVIDTNGKISATGGVIPAAHTHATSEITGLDTALATKYVKPANGIPSSDLASAIQTSLTKADSALQSVADASTSVKGVVQLNNTLTSTSTSQAVTAAQAKVLNDNLTTHISDTTKKHIEIVDEVPANLVGKGVFFNKQGSIPSVPDRSNDITAHETSPSPHQYGGKFEWRYNATTNSLDLVVLP